MKEYRYMTDTFEKARKLAIEASKSGKPATLTPCEQGYRVSSNHCLASFLMQISGDVGRPGFAIQDTMTKVLPETQRALRLQPQVGATIFKLDATFSHCNNKEAIEMIGCRLANAFPGKYSKANGFGRIVQIERPLKYPADNSKAIYPVLKASILRVRKEQCIEFSIASSARPHTPRELEDPDFEAWWYRNSTRSWREQLDLVKYIIADLSHAGLQLEQVDVSPYTSKPVQIENGTGTYAYSGGSLSRISSHPLVPSQKYRFVVFGSDKYGGDNFVADLHSKLQFALKGFSFNIRPVNDDYKVLPSEAAIVLSYGSGSYSDLDRQYSEEQIARLEAEGARFRELPIDVARDATKMSNFAQNLLQAKGNCPWRVVLGEKKIIAALDGGHLHDSRRSRWALSIYDTRSGLLDMRHVDCELQEHITEEVLNSLFGGLDRVDEVWRDGRWHSSDRHWVIERFPDAKLVEIAKRPNAIMFRGSIDSPEPPQYGDAVTLKDGRCYIQSFMDAKRYSVPLRVGGTEGNSDIDGLIALCAMPSLARFQTARLPAPLYWSDLASKLSGEKKRRALGFGWQLT